jgi:uncharacterized membrane protein HdeD (DUF308 family)
MQITLEIPTMLDPVLAVIAGIVSLVKPKMTPYAVGVYLIVVGMLDLLAYL